MIKYLILIIGLAYSSVALADASPKLNPRIEVQFSKDGKTISKFDSIVCFVKYKSSEYEDTLTLFHSSARWWTIGGIKQRSNKNYNLELRSTVEYLKLKLIYSGVEFKSNRIYPISTWSYIIVDIENDKTLSLRKSLFYSKWSDYLSSFLITLLLELIAIVFFKTMRGKFWKVTVRVLLANIVTHPLLWYLDTNFELNLAILELGVILIEFILLTLALSKGIKISSILAYVVTANILSWIFGGIVFWIYSN